jgi:hypothetical protein
MTPSHDIMNVFSHMLLIACQPYTIVTVKELPVFEPNDYFFKHHMKEGEIKWVTYMRVIREIMADALGFKLSEQSLEDKFAYKELLYPSKGLKNKTE